MNEEDFKTTELKDLRSGLSASGKIRSAVLLGPVNGKVLETVTDLGNSITQSSPESFWVNIDSKSLVLPMSGALNSPGIYEPSRECRWLSWQNLP